MKPIGIRNRILLAALAPAILVAFLVSGMLLLEQVEQAHNAQHRRLAAVARLLAAAAEYDLFAGNHDALQQRLERLLEEPDVAGAAILDPARRLVASTVSLQALPRVDQTTPGFGPPATAEAIDHWHSLPIRSANLGEQDLFFPRQENTDEPLGYLLLKISNQSLHDDARHALYTAGAISVSMLLLGTLLALALSRNLIRTLTSVSAVVENIRCGRNPGQVAAGGNDELGQLGQGINAMAEAVTQTQASLAIRIAEATSTLRRERDEASQAALARSRFFAAASHDLRQPVQALGLFVARLERDAHNSPLHSRVTLIAQSVKTLQGLLDTLLDYSRLDGQVYRIDARPLHAADLLSAIHGEFVSSAADKGLDLRLHIQDCWLMTDRALLHRILLNLVGNAIRHTRRGAILLACRHGPTHARIEVWDTGPGIPPEHQETIFEELVQLENPERDTNKGLGLGLAIVRRTADLLGHALQLRSRPGRGSCFSVTVPLADVPVDEHEPADRAEVPATILLLAPQQADDLASTLDGWALPHATAGSADAAIGWITDNGAPALLICETGGDIPTTQAFLDRADHAAGTAMAALLIHPGPAPAEPPRGDQRLLLARPFRPARLRALIDHLLAAAD